MTDSELLSNFVSKRDENAFAEIVLRYERLVWSVCHRLLVNHSDREDAFQDTFLVLARKAHRIRKPESMSNWLYSVAWKSASRIRNRRAMMSLNEYLECGNEISDSAENQLDRIARLSEFELVNRQLQAMSEKHRTPLILFYFAGLSVKQISNQLNLTLAATEGRLRRARKKLRTMSYGSRFEDDAFKESSSAFSGSMLILLGAAFEFKSETELISITVGKSLAAAASVSTGASTGVLTSGAKLMICKYACAVGITALFALGGLAHTGAFLGSNQSQVAQVVVQHSEGNEELSAEFALGNVDGCCDCCDCCDGESSSLSSSIHSHFEMFHLYVGLHAQQVCELIGCCEQEMVDEE